MLCYIMFETQYRKKNNRLMITCSLKRAVTLATPFIDFAFSNYTELPVSCTHSTSLYKLRNSVNFLIFRPEILLTTSFDSQIEIREQLDQAEWECRSGHLFHTISAHHGLTFGQELYDLLLLLLFSVKRFFFFALS